MAGRCLECGLLIGELRMHIKKHKITLAEYDAKHGTKSFQERSIIQRIHVICNNSHEYEMWGRATGLHSRGLYVTSLETVKGLPETALVLCLPKIEELVSDRLAIIRYLKTRGIKIKYYKGDASDAK